MATYITKPGQNLFDIALHLHGSIEGIFDLLITNDKLNMTCDLQPGTKIEYHDNFVINPSVIKMIKAENLVPANSERKVYHKTVKEPLLAIYDVHSWLERISLCISGSGYIVIDWDDNSQPEYIALANQVKCIKHSFDNISDKRKVKLYGKCSLTELDLDNNGILFPIRPINVNNYVTHSTNFNSDKLFLFKDTFRIVLDKCFITNLVPIGKFIKLELLDMTGSTFASTDVLDDYLEYLADNHDGRRNCKVIIDIKPGTRGMAAIDKILSEPTWNTPEKWMFIIQGKNYTING